MNTSKVHWPDLSKDIRVVVEVGVEQKTVCGTWLKEYNFDHPMSEVTCINCLRVLKDCDWFFPSKRQKEILGELIGSKRYRRNLLALHRNIIKNPEDVF